MANDGKQLEQLVKLAEGMRLPEGFTIETNHGVYNDDGVKIAELDILVTGIVGTVKYRTLFECRDRPSEGPAPGSWIQQLIGRRQLLDLSAVVAVSTTGFSPGAIEFAGKGNVEMRSVESLTEEDFKRFPLTAPLMHNKAEAEHIELSLVPEGMSLDDPRVEVIGKTKLPNGMHDECFLELATNRKTTFHKIWNWLLNAYTPIFFFNIPCDGHKVHRTVEVPPAALDGFRFVDGDERRSVGKMVVTGNFFRFPSKLPLTLAVQYGQDSDRPTLVAKWKGDEEEGVQEIVVLLQKRRGETSSHDEPKA